ncbi:MAG: hypothetical protein WDA28_12785 [Castellaniella sp.]
MSYSVFGWIDQAGGAGTQGPPGVGFKLDIDGNYDMEGKKITNIGAATLPGDVATRAAVTSEVGALEDSIELQLIDKVSAAELSSELDNFVDLPSQQTVPGQKTWQAQQNFMGPIMGISAMLGNDKVSYTPAADVSVHIQKASGAKLWLEGDAWPNDWGTPPVESFNGAITYLSAGHTTKTLSRTQMMSNHSISLYSQADQTLPEFQVRTGGLIDVAADAGILPAVLSEPAVRLTIDNANTRITNKLGVNVAAGSSLTGGLTVQSIAASGRQDAITIKDDGGVNQWYINLDPISSSLRFGKAGVGYNTVVLSNSGNINTIGTVKAAAYDWGTGTPTLIGSSTSTLRLYNSAGVGLTNRIAEFSGDKLWLWRASSQLGFVRPGESAGAGSVSISVPLAGISTSETVSMLPVTSTLINDVSDQTVGGNKTYTNDITAGGISLAAVDGRVTALESAPVSSTITVPFTYSGLIGGTINLKLTKIGNIVTLFLPYVSKTADISYDKISGTLTSAELASSWFPMGGGSGATLFRCMMLAREGSSVRAAEFRVTITSQLLLNIGNKPGGLDWGNIQGEFVGWPAQTITWMTSS